MQQHIYDAKKDAPDLRDHLAAPSGLVLPSNVSLRPMLGPIKDQGSLGSCTAHAGTGLREFLYRRFFAYEVDKTVPVLSFRLSPLFLYACEREIEGDFKEDAGAQSRTIYKAMSSMGCCLETEDPYVTHNVFKALTPDQLTQGQKYRHISYHRAMTLNILKSVIASGYVATVGMPVFSSFESDETAATGNVTVPTAADSPIGGHEMLVCGYNDKRAALEVRNSWGADWGDNGCCWIPYAYFAGKMMEQVDFWTGHLGKPWV